ncbi:ArsR/SmtB family transcription factor [Gimibacter soli]|uniref:Metalloregulator ArsR/SmtB family transcription factor n=1 Tax=Gimibacter soli TaxID=3024400 RepID=A0AAF0BN68_9PROT|nr:metalloregulator ArsR/SmtB family transcription factor [Gimibacter soli]WCL55531.1 metalloregulator ArsR/SmtB family transcription factor [Gimibacter soli]
MSGIRKVSMDDVLTILRAAGEATRLRILALLRHGELTVSEIVQVLDQSQPRVSRHLKLLGEAGLLTRVQEGTLVFYRLSESGTAASLLRAMLAPIDEAGAEVAADLEALANIRDERFAEAQAYFRDNAARWNEIRSLYVAEAEVEKALVEMAGEAATGSVLDIGTGTGRMLEIFAPKAARAVGIDMSRDMLAVARGQLANAGLTDAIVRQGDMYDLQLEDGSRTLVLFHQVLHYADDPALALREAARVLAPGGRVLVADFAPHTEEFLRTEHAHRRLGFADDDMKAWGAAAGLIPTDIRHLGGAKLGVTIWQFDKPRTDL